jgi:hypothetical protein
MAFESKIESLHSELTFDSGKKWVLMISFASDEMIRETMKYPEVFFMECTLTVSKQKRELFFCHSNTFTKISPF